MLLASSGFVTICPKKELDLHTADHRADHAAELKAEIGWEAKGATGNEYAYLPGGAVRAINPNSSMTLAQQAECIAVFKGNLTNKADLAMQLVGCPPHLSEAQLLLQMYATYGLDMLPRLHGKFAFCLYDSKQARVFAARDHGGEIPLLEGRTAAGSLIIACGTFMPEGVTQLVDIGPGEYKYGWHALPRTFHCGTKIVAGRASCDYGIRRRSIDAYNAPARSPMSRSISLDIPNGSGSHPTTPTSHSMTPGRYVPPHLAAAFAGGAGPGAAAGAGYLGRSRSASYDGHNLHAAPPHAASAGRRRSETSWTPPGPAAQGQPRHSGGHTHHPHSNQQQHKHHQQWQPKTPFAAATPASPAAAGAAVDASARVAPASPTAAPLAPGKVAAAAVEDPRAAAPAVSRPPAATQCSHQEAVTPPGALGPASPAAGEAAQVAPKTAEHPRRKRRHHRRCRNSKDKDSHDAHDAAAAAAAQEEHTSDSESLVSSSTLDSVSSSALATTHSAGLAPGPAASSPRQASANSAGKQASSSKSCKDIAGPVAAAAASEVATASKATALPGKHHPQNSKQAVQPPHLATSQRRSSSGSGGSGQGGGSFKRNSSCGELAVLGTSPTAAHAALLAGPQQGLAC